MKIIGIESSCDETACAVVEDHYRVLSNVVASQVKEHRKFGGVVPEVAARRHLDSIDLVLHQALDEAGVNLADCDGIAVTQGPGLIGALLVGVSYAKGLAARSGLPLIPVNHVHAHIHGALLNSNPDETNPEALYPCLALVASGGHTNLYLMNSPTSFELLARSIDDACGECFDKVGKMLGFAYPGGPKIEAAAAVVTDKAQIPMPRMVAERSKLFFSFAGLKTHLVQTIHKLGPEKTAENLGEICASFQEEALGQVVRKLQIVIGRYPGIRTLLIAGGVSANGRFKELLSSAVQQKTIFPPLAYCSDNGAMIAALGGHLLKEQKDKNKFHWSQPWDAYSRYQFGDL